MTTKAQINENKVTELRTLADLETLILNYKIGVITAEQFNKQLSEVSKLLNKNIIK